MGIETIFFIIVLVLSIVIHEVAHGYAANMLGDPTARLQGRLTLNPISHIDPLGSIILPGILILISSPILFGWAKPVPYNPYNLRNAKWGEAIVAAAGPLVNILIAVVFALFVRVTLADGDMGLETVFAGFIVYINMLLALFNLIPIPPLDGSKILKSLLPYHMAQTVSAWEAKLFQYGFFVTLLLVFLVIQLILPVFLRILDVLYTLLTGVPLGALLQMFFS